MEARGILAAAAQGVHPRCSGQGWCQKDLHNALGYREGWANAHKSGPGYRARGWRDVDLSQGLQDGDVIIYHSGDTYDGDGYGHVGVAVFRNGEWMLYSQMSGSWKFTRLGRFSEALRKPSGTASQGPPVSAPAPASSAPRRQTTPSRQAPARSAPAPARSAPVPPLISAPVAPSTPSLGLGDPRRSILGQPLY